MRWQLWEWRKGNRVIDWLKSNNIRAVMVQGYNDAGEELQFLPLYAPDHQRPHRQVGYYTIWREPRVVSETARREGPRSGYVGSEVFVSLVDPMATSHHGEATPSSARCAHP